ncbi:MAG: hypothetical protein Q8R25_00235 [bacterium]|nr:hypothetical protein [bacterium]
MMEQLLNIAVVMTLCFTAFGGFHLFMHKRGINYVDHYFLVAGYFLSVATLSTLIFWQSIILVLQDFSATPLIVLTLFMFCQIVLYMYLPKYFCESAEYFVKYPDRYYLKIDWRRLVSKSMDILAQQVFIVLLVLFLQDAGLSLIQIIMAFTFLFGLLHVPLIAHERGAWPSWLFAGIVVVFSIIFPILILKVQYGFVYNYMIHWLFYTVTATSFQIWYAKRNVSLGSGSRIQ